MTEDIWACGSWIAGLEDFVSFPFPKLVAAPLPTMDSSHSGSASLGQTIAPIYTGDGAAAISTSNRYPSETARWLDVAYTEFGHLLFNYGIEGETFELRSGRPELMDSVKEDLEKQFHRGNLINSTIFMYSRGPIPGPFITSSSILEKYVAATAPDSVESLASWKVNTQESPAAVLDHYPEERAAFQKIMHDIEQFHLRSLSHFISGQRSLEDFDDYVRQILQMGLNEAIVILEQAHRSFSSKTMY
jgi:putative aldouronate transport system substrate-binding protein